ncbi:SDR family oxidoreductase [Streptomyces violaceochromogenes]|uniref:SDR family oxidoreductase n=1 Tax=Streptomyces violaceochromogenes TaxID=67377 RepID=A0ABU6LWZ6_9ACTN|nr:SDR family oxidoreductase [Streptomyces violaceochromogenes]MEC7054050.1 SDR family oxidoreductase [Streptomyces violaceochromogenes]
MALISGRARGPGRAAALRFAAEGAIVVDGDLRHESELRAQRLVARAGGAALTPGPLDATGEDSVRAWVEEAADAFGGIDILYSDADAVRFGAADTQPYEDFGCTMRAELDSVWPAAQVARPHLVRSRTRIVAVGPPAGLTGSLTNQRTAFPHSVQGRGDRDAPAARRRRSRLRHPRQLRQPRDDRHRGPVRRTRRPTTIPCGPSPATPPSARVGLPDEVVNGAVFLASDEAATSPAPTS